MKSDKKEHWEKVFSTKQEHEVSWFQRKPETSIRFFTENNIPKDAEILEIGGGDSYLIDSLLDLGYENLTLLDISENAVERAKKRLGERGEKVNYVVSDILTYKTEVVFDVIHDRASFHFMTEESEVERYRKLISEILADEGYYFVGTFSESGPLKCSGLDISQYSEQKLADLFSEDFKKLKCFTEDHRTPSGTVQNFIFCTFKKTGSPKS